MKGKPTIPNCHTVRALMTGSGADIDNILRNGMRRSEKVNAVIDKSQLPFVPESFRPKDGADAAMNELRRKYARSSLTFGRDRVKNKDSEHKY